MNCSFCATQLPADAVYCAECGRPAMSRRARRSADAAPKRSRSARVKRAEKKAQAAALLSARRRHSVENTEGAEVNAETFASVDETHQFGETAPAASDSIVLQLVEPLVL